jgi:hypothetical protein
MKADTPGRHLLRSLKQPDVLAGNALARRFFDGKSLDDGQAAVVEAVRWCLKAEPRLLYIFEACDVRGEPHKKIAADLHLTRRHFYRLRNALIERIAQSLPRAESSVRPAISLRQIDTLVRLVDLDGVAAVREQLDVYRAIGTDCLPLTFAALRALSDPDTDWTLPGAPGNSNAQNDLDSCISRAIRLRAVLARTASERAATDLQQLLASNALTATPYLRSSCFAELGEHYHRAGDVNGMIRGLQNALDALVEDQAPQPMICEARTILASAKLSALDQCASAILDLLTVLEAIDRHDLSSVRASAYLIMAYANKTIVNTAAARECAARAAAECRGLRSTRVAAILSAASRVEAAFGDTRLAMQWARTAKRIAPDMPMIELRTADVASYVPEAGRVHVSETGSGGCTQHAHYHGSRLLVEARSERGDRRARRELLADALPGLRRGAPLHELYDALELLKAERRIGAAEERERRDMVREFNRLRSTYSSELLRPLGRVG